MPADSRPGKRVGGNDQCSGGRRTCFGLVQQCDERSLDDDCYAAVGLASEEERSTWLRVRRRLEW